MSEVYSTTDNSVNMNQPSGIEPTTREGLNHIKTSSSSADPANMFTKANTYKEHHQGPKQVSVVSAHSNIQSLFNHSDSLAQPTTTSNHTFLPLNTTNTDPSRKLMPEQAIKTSPLMNSLDASPTLKNAQTESLPSLQQFGLLFSHSLIVYPSVPPKPKVPFLPQPTSLNSEQRSTDDTVMNDASTLSQQHSSSILNQLVQSQQQNEPLTGKQIVSKQQSSMPTHTNSPFISPPPSTSFVQHQAKSVKDCPTPKQLSPERVEPSTISGLPSNPMIYEGLLKLVAHRIIECMMACLEEKSVTNETLKKQMQDEWSTLVNEYFIVGKRLQGLSQVLHCLFEMLTTEPDILILEEKCQQQGPNHIFSMVFKANLRILRLKFCTFFMLYKLSEGTCFQKDLEEFLEMNSLSIDEKTLTTMSWEQFILEMDALERNLRFKVDLVPCEDNDEDMDDVSLDFMLKNNTMNNVRLISVMEEKLTAAFEHLYIDQSLLPRQQGQFRLQLSVQMSTYLTVMKQSNLVIVSDVTGRNVTMKTISDATNETPLLITSAERRSKLLLLRFNKDFFITPGRDKADFDFSVELVRDNERATGVVRNVFIDKLVVDSMGFPAKYVNVMRGAEILCNQIEIVASTTDAVYSNMKKLSIATSFMKDDDFMSASPGSASPSPLLAEDSHSRSKRAIEEENTSPSGANCSSPSGSKRLKNKHSQQFSNIMHYVRSLKDRCAFSLLHIAAFNGFEKAIEFLSDALNMPIDSVDNYQYSPFHWACFAGKSAAAKMLIRRGASTSRKNVHSATGLEIAEAREYDSMAEELENEIQRHACSTLYTLFTADDTIQKPLSHTFQNTITSQDWSSPQGNNLPNLKIPHKPPKPAQQSNDNMASNKPKLNMPKKKKEAIKISPTSTISSSSKKPKSGGESPVVSSIPGNPQSHRMELFIKPSRKKRTYISFFPKELCSSPYKYDILLRIPLNYTNQFNESHFTFHLMIQGSDKQWTAVSEQAVEIVKYLRTMFPVNYREIEWRLMYKVCSFHYGRKPFKLRVIYNTNSNPTTALPIPEPSDNSDVKTTLPDNIIVFESEEFHIVARKKKENDYFLHELGDEFMPSEPTSPSQQNVNNIHQPVPIQQANTQQASVICSFPPKQSINPMTLTRNDNPIRIMAPPFSSNLPIAPTSAAINPTSESSSNKSHHEEVLTQ